MGANDFADLAAIRGLQDRAGEGNGSGFELGKKILHVLIVLRVFLIGCVEAEQDVGKGIHVIIVLAKLRFLFPDGHHFVCGSSVLHPPGKILVLGDGCFQVGLDVLHLVERDFGAVRWQLAESF